MDFNHLCRKLADIVARLRIGVKHRPYRCRHRDGFHVDIADMTAFIIDDAILRFIGEDESTGNLSAAAAAASCHYSYCTA